MSIIDGSLFLTMSSVAAILMPPIMDQYARWGTPVNEKKRLTEGEFGHLITWAGVEHDLDADTHRVHGDKCIKWAAAVKAIRRAGKCSLTELRSLLGLRLGSADLGQGVRSSGTSGTCWRAPVQLTPRLRACRKARDGS
jgi:hypothetical protein